MIEIHLSEGNVCIFESEPDNTVNKETFILFKNEYYAQCQSSVFDVFYSPSHTTVLGYPPVSEYTIFSENYELMDDYITSFPDFDETNMKDYNYTLYMNNYEFWNIFCYSSVDGYAVTPSMVAEIIEDAGKIRSYAIVILSMSCGISFLCLLNLFVFFLKNKAWISALSAKKFNFYRFLCTSTLSIVCMICILCLFLLTND